EGVSKLLACTVYPACFVFSLVIYSILFYVHSLFYTSLERLLLEDMTGERSPEAAESREDGGFARLLGDILTTSKRSWSRFKKGGGSGCFGRRIDRIGSTTSLGCNTVSRSRNLFSVSSVGENS
uniref:Uncharacterized protein n=1 Tax=Denticeps clupeoides TaxID=299321 RepID=A0AAY4C5H1_9TELE